MIVDTSPLVALANKNDDHHARCRDLLLNAAEPLLVPASVLTEVCYMLGRDPGGAELEALFLEDLADDVFRLVNLTEPDLRRTAALVRQYADFPLGAVDASVVAVAERLNVTTVATLDQRHFRAVRPTHCTLDGFVLVP